MTSAPAPIATHASARSTSDVRPSLPSSGATSAAVTLMDTVPEPCACAPDDHDADARARQAFAHTRTHVTARRLLPLPHLSHLQARRQHHGKPDAHVRVRESPCHRGTHARLVQRVA